MGVLAVSAWEFMPCCYSTCCARWLRFSTPARGSAFGIWRDGPCAPCVRWSVHLRQIGKRKNESPLQLQRAFSCIRRGQCRVAFFIAPLCYDASLGFSPFAFARNFFALIISSGRYSKCMRSKCSHFPPQMKPLSSKSETMAEGKVFCNGCGRSLLHCQYGPLSELRSTAIPKLCGLRRFVLAMARQK